MIDWTKTLTTIGIVILTPLAVGQDQTLQIWDIQANPGTEVEMEVRLNSASGNVSAWSMSICHDPVELVLLAAEVATGLDPDFEFTNILPEGLQTTVVLDINVQISLPPGNYAILVATYDVFTPLGVTSLVEFCDTIGDPPTQTLVVVDNTEVVPIQDSGSVESVSTPIPPGFRFGLTALNGYYFPDVGEGQGEVSVTVEELGSLVTETLGFSVGLAHDPGLLDAIGATTCPILRELNGGSGPEVFLVDVQPDGITVQVEYGGGQLLIFPDPEAVLEIDYQTVVSAFIGQSDDFIVNLEFVDYPGVANEVTQASPPTPLSPVLLENYLTLRAAGAPYNDTYTIADATVPPGGIFAPVVQLENPTLEVAAVAMGVCHNSQDLTLVDVELGVDIATINGGNPPDVFFIEIITGVGFTFSSIFGFSIPTPTIPIDSTSEILQLEYAVIGSAGRVTELDFCQLGDPPVPTIIQDNMANVRQPVKVGADVQIGTPTSPPILRGDADGDGSFNGLLDGLFILGFQFIPGSDAPPCFDAADADDSGDLNGLIDGLLMLNFQFVPGTPPLPAPGINCGFDPTTDSLSCDEPACP